MAMEKVVTVAGLIAKGMKDEVKWPDRAQSEPVGHKSGQVRLNLLWQLTSYVNSPSLHSSSHHPHSRFWSTVELPMGCLQGECSSPWESRFNKQTNKCNKQIQQIPQGKCFSPWESRFNKQTNKCNKQIQESPQGKCFSPWESRFNKQKNKCNIEIQKVLRESVFHLDRPGLTNKQISVLNKYKKVLRESAFHLESPGSTNKQISVINKYKKVLRESAFHLESPGSSIHGIIAGATLVLAIEGYAWLLNKADFKR